MSTVDTTVEATEPAPNMPNSVPASVKGTDRTPATSPTSRDVSSRMPKTRQKSPLTRCHERRMDSIAPLPSSTTMGEAKAKRVVKNR